MTTSQPHDESPREALAAQAADAYADYTEAAAALPPELAALTLKMRDLMTDVAAQTAGQDLRLERVEEQQRMTGALLDGSADMLDGSMASLAAILRSGLAPEQLAELAALISEP